jgi:hypothetical protein
MYLKMCLHTYIPTYVHKTLTQISIGKFISNFATEVMVVVVPKYVHNREELYLRQGMYDKVFSLENPFSICSQFGHHLINKKFS